jgi:hypothetical protein
LKRGGKKQGSREQGAGSREARKRLYRRDAEFAEKIVTTE